MSTEVRELHRIIRASVRDMLDAYRIQAQVGPVSGQALEGIIFRATHPVVDSLAPYQAAERAALLPSVVRVMLASFLEDVAGAAHGLPIPSAVWTRRQTKAHLPVSGWGPQGRPQSVKST